MSLNYSSLDVGEFIIYLKLAITLAMSDLNEWKIEI